MLASIEIFRQSSHRLTQHEALRWISGFTAIAGRGLSALQGRVWGGSSDQPISLCGRYGPHTDLQNPKRPPRVMVDEERKKNDLAHQCSREEIGFFHQRPEEIAAYSPTQVKKCVRSILCKCYLPPPLPFTLLSFFSLLRVHSVPLHVINCMYM